MKMRAPHAGFPRTDGDKPRQVFAITAIEDVYSPFWIGRFLTTMPTSFTNLANDAGIVKALSRSSGRNWTQRAAIGRAY